MADAATEKKTLSPTTNSKTETSNNEQSTDSFPKIPLLPAFGKKSTFLQKSDNDWSSNKSNLFNNTGSNLFGSGVKPKNKEDGLEGKLEAPSGFVFGSRLAERVEKKDGDDGPKDASSIFKKFSDNAPSSGLFCKPVSSKDSNESVEIKPFSSNTEEKTKKVELEDVETFTGEEGETNLLHFIIFDAEKKTWQERGNGTLRINRKNDDHDSYRIVGRSTGNQRVCVNTNIFPDQLLERINEKRLKISALNPGSHVPQLVVISASVAASAIIERKLEELIAKVKSLKRKRKLERNEEDESEAKKEPEKKNEEDSEDQDE